MFYFHPHWIPNPGASGVLGSAVCDAFKNSNDFEILSLAHSRSGDGLLKLDLLDKDHVGKVFGEFKPDCGFHNIGAA